jgi:hypothetical protein
MRVEAGRYVGCAEGRLEEVEKQEVAWLGCVGCAPYTLNAIMICCG